MRSAWAFLLAFALTLVLVPPVVWALRSARMLDQPSARSSHIKATPRGGGVALAIGCLAAWFVEAPRGPWLTVVVIAACGFGLVGLADDVRRLPARLRLGLQVMVAALALPSALHHLTGPLLWKIIFGLGCASWLVSYVNAFNFMDGINGISVGQVVIAGLTYFAVGEARHVGSLAVASLGLVGAALAFMPYNFPKGRVFLGDSGSYFLGGALAALLVVGLRAGVPPECVLGPVVVYLSDTGTTIVRRAFRGEPWLEAHRDHTYQRLVRGGWSHATTTGIVTVATAACSALGLASLQGNAVLRGCADALMLAVCAGYLACPRVAFSGEPAS